MAEASAGRRRVLTYTFSTPVLLRGPCAMAPSPTPPTRCRLPPPQILFYPTAIGSEPPAPGYSSYLHWARVMQGHAGANMVRECVCVWWGGCPVDTKGVVRPASPRRPSRHSIPDSPPPPPLPQLPVVASNRIGTETFERSHITFYGGSFIAGPTGEIVAQAGVRGAQQANGGVDPAPEQAEGFITATFDLTECRENRAG